MLNHVNLLFFAISNTDKSFRVISYLLSLLDGVDVILT